jgi:Kef-type K+ transport system membrane component KefB
MQIPSVIGELLAGILIGPSVLGLVEATPSIHLLAQIGIILLLFEVGLETDVGRLISAGPKAFLVAVTGVIMPLILGFAISHYVFDFSTLASLFVGCTLTATSIGITLRVLSELKKQSTGEAQVILGAAVLDDIIGIVLLALLFEFSESGEVNLWNSGKVLLFISIFFLTAPVAAKAITTAVRRWEAKSDIPGLLPTMIVSIILFFAWLSYELGAPEILGGFAAGLALSRQFVLPFATFLKDPEEFTHRVHKQMTPIIHLFTPIFFVTIGLSLNLKEIEWGSSYIWLLTGSLLVIAAISKMVSSLPLFKESWFSKLIIGTAMIPRGEVGLIFAEVGLKSGVLGKEIYASLILVIAFTTLIAPFGLRWLYAKEPTEKEA